MAIGPGHLRAYTRQFSYSNAQTFALPVNVELPRLDNYTPRVGDVVSIFDQGEWLATPAVTSYTYQLQKDQVDVGATSATNSYTAVAGDVGKRIRWGVFAHNANGRSTLIAYTSQAEPVLASVTEPVNTVIPNILGTSPPVQDETQLTANIGEWTNFPTGYAYKWQRTTTDIPGAVSGNYTPVAADVGFTLRVGVAATNGAGTSAYVFSEPTEIVEASAPVGTRIAGLGWTPDYVDPAGTQPATFAAAETFAAAHPELFPTGLINVNSHASLEAGIDAANTADKALAIGIDSSTSAYTITATKRYCKRGLIGFGSAYPTVTFARTSANWNKSPHLFAHTQDIACRFIKWVNTDIIFSCTHPTLPRIRNGVLTDNSWLGPGIPWIQSSTGQNAASFRMLRCGKVTPSGSGNITSMYMRREIEGIAVETSSSFEMAGKLEDIPLISGTITAVTPTKIRDAVNLLTGTHLITALLSDDGLSVLFTKAERGYPLEIVCVCTGTLTCGTDPLIPWNQDENNNTWGCGFDIQYCEFPDCNLVIGGRSDVTAIGPIKFHKNDCPGMWGGFCFFATRWSRVWIANNHWRECYLGRPAAAGRTSSRQPNGTQSEYNTFSGMIASGSPHLPRYQGTVLLVENNQVTDVESDNIQFNYNSAVFAHFIAGYDRLTINGVTGGYVKHAWNKGLRQHRANGGDDDGGWCYGNSGGLVVEHNVYDQVGEGYANSNFVGTEAVMNFKEGGFLSTQEQGLRCLRHIRGRDGIPLCKFDSKAVQLHEQIYIEEFNDAKGGVPYVNNLNSGALCFLGIINRFALRQVFIKNANFYPEVNGGGSNGTGHCITFGRVIATNMDFSNFELNNIYLQNDGSPEYPEYTGDVPMFIFTFQAFPTGMGISNVAAAFNATSKIRDCYVLNAAGTIVGNITGVLWPDGIVNRTFAPNGRGDALPRLTSVDTDGIPHFGAVW